MEGKDMKPYYPEWMRSLGRVCREQGSSIFVEVPLPRLEKTMERVKRHGVGVVNAISGHDSGRYIEVLYHFIHQGVVLTVKTRVKRGLSAVPSVVRLFPSAMLFEQENHEMLGLKFTGNPRMRPVLLGKASPKTPLRKKEVKK
jgi:NADH:ubiquinone oxidoreductase subunit C